MIRIIVDEAVCDKLTGVGDRAELCDKSGRVIGFFEPAPSDDYEGFESPLSDKELAARGVVRRSADGRTPGYPCRVS